MSERLSWQRGDKPYHYVAHPTGDPEECEVSVHFGPGPGGRPVWHYGIRAGRTMDGGNAEDKQSAADIATARWPAAVEREAAAVAAVEDVQDFMAMLQAARITGGVNIDAFGLDTSSADRLYFLMRKVQPYARGALRPLAAALDLELGLRRNAGEDPGLGVYGTRRVAWELEDTGLTNLPL